MSMVNLSGPRPIEDTYVVSQSSPLFDLLEHYEDTMPTADLLDTLESYRQHVRDYTEAAVRKARREGMTWEQIGTALGITRQAAHQQYSAR